MDVTSALSGLGSGFLYYIPPFLFVLTMVVFFHELGHFLIARWCGVRVSAFSIGFGPEIFGFNDRYGTRWRVAWIPLGGYVKFIDDDNASSVPTKTQDDGGAAVPEGERFHSKPLWQRAAVVVAGPMANFILALVIFAGIFAVLGERLTLPRVDEVTADGAAAKAGFKPGDLVLSIDGTAIESFADMQRIVSGSADRELVFIVERGADKVTIKATPDRKETSDHFGNKYRIGMLGIRQSIKPEDWRIKSYDPITAVWRAAVETHFVIGRTLAYLRDVVTGREAADQLGGPIKIAKVSGEVASQGAGSLLYLVAVLSISIGLLNLFPVPILDGGHLLFYAIEAFRGQPLSERAQEVGFRIGLALLVMLMIFAAWNDIAG